MAVFSDIELKRLVDEVKGTDIPEDHKFAFVGTTDLRGIQGVAVFRKDDSHWRFEAAFRHEWRDESGSIAGATEGNSAVAKVIWSI